MKHYIIRVEGEVEAMQIGPFCTAAKRTTEAVRLAKEIDSSGQFHEVSFFWADVDESGDLNVGAFTNSDFED